MTHHCKLSVKLENLFNFIVTDLLDAFFLYFLPENPRIKGEIPSVGPPQNSVTLWGFQL